MTSSKRVAVVGCGPSGMAFLSAVRNAEMKGEKVPDVVCFEKQSTLTGMWNYTWRTGLDQYGEYVHGSMYNSLWSNTPKECMEMADYTYKDHFNKHRVPSFLPRRLVRDYLLGKANKNNIESLVSFNTVVRQVKQENGCFVVLSQNLLSQNFKEEYFDYVIVATGHFSFPDYPMYEGLKDFTGRVLHSHDFKKSDEFFNQAVLIVGAGFSGEDIALQLYKYGVKDIIISYRQRPLGFDWPQEIREVPEIKKIEGRKVTFIDESCVEPDAIIFCTGYKHQFHFLEEELRLKCKNELYPDHLYQGVVFNNNTNLFYMGMQNQIFTFPMFDAQAYYIRDCILGKIEIDSYAERLKDIDDWRKCQRELIVVDDLFNFQRDYILELLSHTNYPANHIESMCEMFKQIEKDKRANILTYRDHSFISACTGIVASKVEKPWLDVKDMSLFSAYLRTTDET